MEGEKRHTKWDSACLQSLSLSLARASVRARVLKRHFKSREEI